MTRRLTTPAWRLLVATLCVVGLSSPVLADNIRKRDTIKSLENKKVEVRPGKLIVNSNDLARDNYRAFLDLFTDDPVLRAEAMRRLGDLELEATESEQLIDNIDSLDTSGYDSAVGLYQQLLEAYPDYRRNDTVLYQLARAYEIGGRTDDALVGLNDLVAPDPATPPLQGVQVRRGEMLFLRKRYNEAEAAYTDVVKGGEASRFYEQSLYKLGWSRFKLAWHDDSFPPFFDLLDRKIGGVELEALFDLNYHLKHVDTIFDRVFGG